MTNLLFKTLLLLLLAFLALLVYGRIFGLPAEILQPLPWLSAVNSSDSKADEKPDDSNREATKEGDDEAGGEAKLLVIDGHKALRLEAEQIEDAGLEIQSLTAIRYMPEFMAHAEIVEASSLLAITAEHADLAAQQEMLRQQLHYQNKSLERAQALQRTKNLAAKEVQQQRAARDLSQAELKAIEVRLQNLLLQTRASWGEQLSQLIFANEQATAREKLAAHQSFLIQISLPRSEHLDSPQQRVHVSSRQQREGALELRYLGPAYRSSKAVYGESYYYLLDAPSSDTQFRFAWIEQGKEAVAGVMVPDTAVVWHANEPWVYLQHDEETFIRHSLRTGKKIAAGWLVEKELEPSQQIVVRGGQTLLSEEFKWAIPDEDND